MTPMFDKLVALLEAEAARFRVSEHPPEGRSDLVAAIRGTEPGQGAKAMLCKCKDDDRTLVLSGKPATDFQRTELVRLFSQLPGVGRAQWENSPAGTPLVVEGAAIAVLGFLFGLLLAYLIELHRRYNAQWNW